MNEAIEKIARTHIPDIGSAKLSFVKFNTAGSPFRGVPKVLFFCFVGTEREPRWCLKTVRASANNAVISKGFANLEALNKLAGTKNIFARAIWMGEVDGVAWSIEEAAPGRRPVAADISRVIDAYIAFQKNAGIVRTIPAKERAEELARELGVLDDVHDLCAAHCKGDIALLPQHGDFTQDNVLVDGSRVTLIDCDSFMPEGVAGFDLFHFLSRTSRTSSQVADHMSTYRKVIGTTREFNAGDLIVWILQEHALKKAQGASPEKELFAVGFNRSRKIFQL